MEREMSHPQFEAVKVALKQDRTGYILTLNIHPDDLDERILRDFVGARYQVVMVRLNGDEAPMNRDRDIGMDPVKLAGILCKDKDFQEYLFQTGQILEPEELSTVGWLRTTLEIESRTELRNDKIKAQKLYAINEGFKSWKHAG